jgi:hypothetical protein
LTSSPFTEYATATWSCAVVPNRPAAIEADVTQALRGRVSEKVPALVIAKLWGSTE